MQVEKEREGLRLILGRDEVRLLRRVLQRASFVDTPASEQAEIAEFCERLLPELGEGE